MPYYDHMSSHEAPTQPPGLADDRALVVAQMIGRHDREIAERGVQSSNVLRALALGELAAEYGLELPEF